MFVFVLLFGGLHDLHATSTILQCILQEDYDTTMKEKQRENTAGSAADYNLQWLINFRGNFRASRV